MQNERQEPLHHELLSRHRLSSYDFGCLTAPSGSTAVRRPQDEEDERDLRQERTMDTEELQVEVHAEGLDLTTGPHEIVVHLGTGGDVSRSETNLPCTNTLLARPLMTP